MISDDELKTTLKEDLNLKRLEAKRLEAERLEKAERIDKEYQAACIKNGYSITSFCNRSEDDQKLARGRIYPEMKCEKPSHNYAFFADKQRVENSPEWRRLLAVYQFNPNRRFHSENRITHTIDVQNVAERIGRSLGLDQESRDMTAAICAAHDIGHMPFGHAGEAAAQEMLGDQKTWTHDAAGLRVITKWSIRAFSYKGLNLTHGVLEGLSKRYWEYEALPVLPTDEPMAVLKPGNYKHNKAASLQVVKKIAQEEKEKKQVTDADIAGWINTGLVNDIKDMEESSARYFHKLWELPNSFLQTLIHRGKPKSVENIPLTRGVINQIVGTAPLYLTKRSPIEGQLAAISDWIAFTATDIEDGVLSGKIKLEKLIEVFPVAGQCKEAADEDIEQYEADVTKSIRKLHPEKTEEHSRAVCKSLATSIKARLMEDVILQTKENILAVQKELKEHNADYVRDLKFKDGRPLVSFSQDMEKSVEKLQKDFASIFRETDEQQKEMVKQTIRDIVEDQAKPKEKRRLSVGKFWQERFDAIRNKNVNPDADSLKKEEYKTPEEKQSALVELACRYLTCTAGDDMILGHIKAHHRDMWEKYYPPNYAPVPDTYVAGATDLTFGRPEMVGLYTRKAG